MDVLDVLDDVFWLTSCVSLIFWGNFILSWLDLRIFAQMYACVCVRVRGICLTAKALWRSIVCVRAREVLAKARRVVANLA